MAMRVTALETSIDSLYLLHLEWNLIHFRIDINSHENELPKVDVAPIFRKQIRSQVKEEACCAYQVLVVVFFL